MSAPTEAPVEPEPALENRPEYIAVRLDQATIARVDALAPSLASHGLVPKREAILRALILEALEARAKGGAT